MVSSVLYLCCGVLLVFPCLAHMKPDMETEKTDAAPDSGFKSEGTTLTFVPKYSKLLGPEELKKLKDSPSAGTVYFYKAKNEWINHFLKDYDKSAEFLSAYGLTLGLVDCSGDVVRDLDEDCADAIEDLVYIYRFGEKLLDLELAVMFDVDSIMANVLILALLDQVPIVQTKDGRQELENAQEGQKNIVFAYNNAIGSYENRVFMEIAYAYQDRYKFVLSSERSSTEGLQDADLLTDKTAGMIWVLYCQEFYDTTSGCRSVNYRGRLNLMDLAAFFKQLEWPRVVYKTEASGAIHPCELNEDLGCVVLQHSSATKERAEELISSLQFDLHGMIGFIVQQINEGSGETDPQIILQKPGGRNMTVDGNWELEVIENTIAVHLLPRVDNEREMRTDEEDTADGSKVDDMVVQVAYKQKLSSKMAHTPDIPALTDKTFPATTKGSKLTVVLFYLPFEAQGMVFLSPFQEAARKLAAMKGEDPSAHPLARVNCFDWTDVCQKENITSYPVVHIYRKGEKREQYRHALDTDVLVRTVMLLQAEQPLMLKSAEEVSQFLDGQLPSPAYSDVDNLVLLKLTSSQKELEPYKAVVKALETQMLFAIVGPDVKTSLVPKGGVLHKRSRDLVQPLESMTENLEASSIMEFLQKGQFNLFPELTFLNFPALHARKQPFAILFTEPSMPGADDVHHTFVNLIQSHKLHDIIFCKMTVGELNPVARPLLLNYTQTADMPAVAVVYLDKGEVYVLQDKEIKADTLMPWIQAVQHGEMVPSKILQQGEWKPPGRHYDFLAIMDKEKKKNQMKRKEPSEYFSEEDSDTEDQVDAETRSSLLELQQSRLYKDRKVHSDRPRAAGHPLTATMETKMADKASDKSRPQHTEL
ncbi:thioredoxin domain-containing protein 16-like [Babylonia areolata]|uniref:thioredoxin domain-containing protein 16-like n=1 Tax=Babylonia areolata TaxID=304850 RepID=UPI003FD0F5DF